MAFITTAQSHVVKEMGSTLFGHIWCNPSHQNTLIKVQTAKTVDPTGPTGHPAPSSTQKNRAALLINQKLHTHFAVS